MHVFIVGAGAVGSLLARLLAREKEVSSVRVGTNDLIAAKEYLPDPHAKIKVVPIDASKTDSVVHAAKGADLLINSSLPQFNVSVMRAALRVGAHYLDLDSYYADNRNPEQLRLDAQFRRAKLVALINAGVSPGVTNMLARAAADRFDTVDSVKIRLVEEQEASELIFSWSPTVSLNELTSPPLVYRKGKFVFTRPFADAEEFDFPAPIGRKTVVSIYGDEVATLPRYVKTKNVDYKASGMDVEFGQAFYRLGLLRKKPVFFQGKKIVPIEFFSTLAPPAPTPKHLLQLIHSKALRNAYLVLVVEVAGTVSGHAQRIRSSALFPDLRAITRKFPGATYVSYPTAVAALAFAKSIQYLPYFGVFPPERLTEEYRESVLLELQKRDVGFETHSSRR